MELPITRVSFSVGASLRAANCDDCPPGWSWYENRCFHFVKDEKSWADAESHCLSLGGHLASFHSKNEYKFLIDLIYTAGRHKNCWFGAHDAVKDGIWMWSDGSKFVSAPWAKNEPNNFGGDEGCMDIKNGDVNDQSCTDKLPFICATVQ
ncbi:PREDICTED: ladderlectin-like [Cyprinodon variegatus]|uniref:ladderlectin-like n=1 Tax=Cyprinodon variegatus TaxID=28743 RepID=UPI0007429B33|nr:PREDICTED: ladderlectin-like [Cyprinodon variegatus]